MSVAVVATDTTSAAFSQFSDDARATGMGMAATAWASDATLVYWNPAKLAELKHYDLTLMTTTAFETTHTSIFVAAPYWGAGYRFSQTGGINGTQRNTDNISAPTGEIYGFSGQVLYLSTGVALTEAFSVGITGLYIREDIATTNASGIGLTAAAAYKATPWCTVALVAENVLAPTLQWNTPDHTRETLPLTLRSGLMIEVLKEALTLSTDYVSQQNRPSRLNIGTEFHPIPLASVSAGLHNGQLTLGTGLYLDTLRANISWEASQNDVLDNFYRFSIGLSF